MLVQLNTTKMTKHLFQEKDVVLISEVV